MDIEQKVSHYQPTPDTIELVRQTKIVLLVGISGAGKDTIKNELLKDGDYQDIVSHTTRRPRYNGVELEVNGVDYHFVDFDQAVMMLDDQAFVEIKLVHGTLYGTSTREIQRAHDGSKIAITDLDVQGVDEYKNVSRDVVAIFILPPDYKTWIDRLSRRYQSKEDFKTEWPKRRSSAIMELTRALEVPYYHFIINDRLDKSVGIANDIARQPDVFHRKDDEARLAARDLLDGIIANT